MTSDALRGVIGEDAARILDETRRNLSELLDAARALDPDSEAAKNAQLVLDHVDEFFLLVVVGEVKSGKSSFINAFLEENLQAEGPLPLTDRIWVLRHGEEPSERIIDEFVHEKVHPAPLLTLFNVVDTPGTNSIVRKHQDITEGFLPKADLILFVTSIDRPFSETERQFLDLVSARWHKNILFILAKIDSREPEDVAPVVDYIRSNCRKFYDFEPEVFPVSSKWAEAARSSGDESLMEKSGLPALREYLANSLAEDVRLRLKLESPLSAGLALLEDMQKITGSRRSVLDRDFESLSGLDAQIVRAGTELQERYSVFVVKMYDVLREFERRGKTFFETTIRVKNFGLLRDTDAFRRRFEEAVVADLQERVEETMHSATDWLMREEIALFQRCLRFIADNLSLEKYKGQVASPTSEDQSFDYNRDHLVTTMRESFEKEIERFDVQGECHRITESAYRGVLQQVGVQAGAVGLGTLLVTILTGAALDVTGVLAAGVVFATGFIILPRKKKKAIQQFSLKVDVLIREFKKALNREFEAEIEKATERMRAAYTPYLTFYRTQMDVLTASDEKQNSVRLKLLESLESVKKLEITKSGDRPS